MQVALTDYVLGAGVATGLVNTAPRVRSSGDALAHPADLERFLGDHGVHVDAVPAGGCPTDADLRDVHALRGQIRSVIEAAGTDQAVDGATALIRRASLGPSLYRDSTGRWQWCVGTAADASLADELAVLAGVGLLGVLQALDHDRFRHCASPACDGMFVDTSRAGRRRYCMPDLCGNRLNVANHRARRRTGAPPPSTRARP